MTSSRKFTDDAIDRFLSAMDDLIEATESTDPEALRDALRYAIDDGHYDEDHRVVDGVDELLMRLSDSGSAPSVTVRWDGCRAHHSWEPREGLGVKISRAVHEALAGVRGGDDG